MIDRNRLIEWISKKFKCQISALEQVSDIDLAREIAKSTVIELEAGIRLSEALSDPPEKNLRKHKYEKNAEITRQAASLIKKACETVESPEKLIFLVSQFDTWALEERKKVLSKPNLSTEARLFDSRFYEECPSSAITDTVYTAGVNGYDFWEYAADRLNGKKEFSKGWVELQIRDRFDLTDFAEINYQAKEVIAQQFGEETLKLHYALAAIAFRKPVNFDREITVSVSKLLADFGVEKQRKYIPKNARKTHQSTCYLSKEEKLKNIAHHARLLKRIEVHIPEWRYGKGKNSKSIAVVMSNLWDIFSIVEVTDLTLDGSRILTDIEINFRPGVWFQKFAGSECLREFGYITSEAMKLDPYREKMALRLAYFAVFALQQHKTGRYQIESLLRRIGYSGQIDVAKTDQTKAYNLKRSFDRSLKTLSSFQHPYRFELDPEVPEWAKPDSKVKKPNGWFETWLQLYGTLQQPDSLPVKVAKPKRTRIKRKPKTAKTAGAFGAEIKEARMAKGWTQTKLAGTVNVSKMTISYIERGQRNPSPQLETLIRSALDI